MKRFFILMLTAIFLLSAVPQALGDSVPVVATEDLSPIPVIAKENLSPTPKELHHYMLICLDEKEVTDLTNPARMNTDGLILVTVDDIAHRVMLTIFVRDMLIQRPDGKYDRINNIMRQMSPNGDGRQGIQMLIDTINSHFDLQIEKYIVVDWQKIYNIVDAVGGVDIPLTARERNRINSYPKVPTLPAANADGTTHLTGQQATVYMRIRAAKTAEYTHDDGAVYSDTMEMGRNYRASVVVSTIAEKLKNITYQEAMNLLDVILVNMVYTNMTTDDMLEALDLALQMRGVPVKHINMPVPNPTKQMSDGKWDEIAPKLDSFRKGGYSYCEIEYKKMDVKQINYELNRQKLWEFLLDSFVVVDEE